MPVLSVTLISALLISAIGLHLLICGLAILVYPEFACFQLFKCLILLSVLPAEAGIQLLSVIPAEAGIQSCNVMI